MAPELKPATTSVAQKGPQSSLADLDELAHRIKEEHSAVARALHRGFIHASAAGELLIRAKAKAGHGKWLSWLRDECEISGRTASLYMQLAQNRESIERQIGNAVADLTVRRAMKLLAPPRQSDPLAEESADAGAGRVAGPAVDPMAIKDGRRSSKTKRRRRALNAAGPSIPGTGNPSPGDPAPTNSAEPPAVRRTDGDGNYESFKSRWIQYCAADFAALPAALQARFVSEVPGMSVPSGDTARPLSPPPLPFSVQLAAMVAAITMPAISPAEINALNAARRREENEGIARLAAQQRDWQARETRAAHEELLRRRRGGGGH